MRSLHLILMAFCHILLASAILYVTTFNTLEASPLVGQSKPNIDEKVAAAPSAVSNDAKKPEQYSPGQLAPQQDLIKQQPIKPQQQVAQYNQHSPTEQASSPVSPQEAKYQPNGQQSVALPKTMVVAASPSRVEPVVAVMPQFNAPAEIPVVATKVEESAAKSGEPIKQQVAPVKEEQMMGKSGAPVVVLSEQQAAPAVKLVAPSNGKQESVISEKKLVPVEQSNVGIAAAAPKQLEQQPISISKAPEAPVIEKKAPIEQQSSPAVQQAPSGPIESIKTPNSEPIKQEQQVVVQVKQPVEEAPVAEVSIEARSAAPAVVPQPAALVSEQNQSVQEPQQQPSQVTGKSEVPKSYEPKSVVVKEEPYVKPQHQVVAAKLDRKIDDVVQQQPASKVAEEPVVKVISGVRQSAPAVELASGQVSAKSQEHVKQQQDSSSLVASKPVVKGGLGPLQLLATTLCSFQPDKQVADENLNQLYARRANLRKSLLEFMSLKFTNLEKLSSRLGIGLQVVPLKTVGDSTSPTRASGAGSLAPSHGWPVVGKCTAHDLKLMGEAAWCEGELGAAASSAESSAPTSPVVVASASVGSGSGPGSSRVEASGGVDETPAKISSNQHVSSARSQAARSIGSSVSFLASPEQSSVISKLLHVGDIKDAPVVESTIYNLNLTQQQLATLEAQATSTRECRRNALRYTKALFNHLAEDQRNLSESWPQLYGLISADDCARKRMIDIVTALSGFRTDTTSIRRDNLEFAFAMDDLRTKVLENEVNVPLTFDKQFIEVEQFLQQSVRLMLSNIDPNRAKLTSMRYRSLMYGTVNSDDQCIELHQRLLAQSYPTDCNPNQFGQLPDVLRMTASSLELWSIEKEISLRTGKVVDYPNTELVGQQKVKEDVNECIANLVSS